jgi:DNA gyrase subunit B
LSETSYTVSKDAEHDRYSADIISTRFAQRTISRINFGFASSLEFEELKNIWKTMNENVALPITIKKGSETLTFQTYQEFFGKMIEASKKGQYIQRYKGLGEMNPEQLWETTLNPANRTLLQVKISDAIAADETFSVLMGEEVELRRKFIEDNALLVQDLDV